MTSSRGRRKVGIYDRSPALLDRRRQRRAVGLAWSAPDRRPRTPRDVLGQAHASARHRPALPGRGPRAAHAAARRPRRRSRHAAAVRIARRPNSGPGCHAGGRSNSAGAGDPPVPHGPAAAQRRGAQLRRRWAPRPRRSLPQQVDLRKPAPAALSHGAAPRQVPAQRRHPDQWCRSHVGDRRSRPRHRHASRGRSRVKGGPPIEQPRSVSQGVDRFVAGDRGRSRWRACYHRPTVRANCALNSCNVAINDMGGGVYS